MITKELTQESTMGDDIWDGTSVLGTREMEVDEAPEATTDTETQGSVTPRRPERRPASMLGDDMESAAKRLREVVDRRTWDVQPPPGKRLSCDERPPSMRRALGRDASTKTVDSSQLGNEGTRGRPWQTHEPNPGLNFTRTTIPSLPRTETDRTPLIHTLPTILPVKPPTRVVFNGCPIKMTSQEIRALMEELLKPMQDKLESLEKAQGSSLEVRMEHRKIALEARKRNADEELRAIADKTWKAPFDVIGSSNAMIPYNHNQTREQKIRYDPNLLPKFRHDGDVEEWIMAVQQFIDTHGETVVCPTLAWHCFEAGDPVKIWYSILGGRNHAYMTKEEGCWVNFQEKMRDVWSRPMAVTQREAEAREKQPTETFLIYYFQKLNMLMKAFPESLEATHVSRIRARFNDAQADRYIRETQSLRNLANEIKQYDDHLKLHPVASVALPRPTNNSYSNFTPRAGYVDRSLDKTNVLKPTDICHWHFLQEGRGILR